MKSLATLFLLFGFLMVNSQNKLAVPFNHEQIENRMVSQNARFFAFGSWHGHKGAFKSFVTVFKVLHKKANVRVFVYECSYALGVLLNDFVTKGIRNEFFDLFMFKVDFEYLFVPLREYYLTLSEEEKFIIEGVDGVSIRGYPDAICLIKSLGTSGEPDVLIEPVIDELKSFSILQSDFKLSSSLLNALLSSYNQYPNLYKSYYGVNFPILKKTLQSYSQTKNYSDCNFENADSASFNQRENYIYHNIVEIIEGNPNVNYIGLFGLAHVFLNRTNRFDSFQIKQGDDYQYYPFIARLYRESDSPVKGFVCAAQIHESNLLFRNALKETVGKQVFRQMIKHSKLNRTYIFDFTDDKTHDDISQNKFQYLILVR